MIKKLRNQKEERIYCIKTQGCEVAYQSFNYLLSPPRPFGPKLCRKSDECNRTDCPYHNANVHND